MNPLRLIGLSALVALSGCVRVYQPMSGLYRPVVVDTTAPNLVGLRLGIECVPGDLLGRGGAGDLCRPLRRLFENQGAIVTILDGRGLDKQEVADQQPPELVLQIRSRETFLSNNLVTWVASIATFTLFPATTEAGFAQEITIKDTSGFQLVTDELEGRIVERIGAGTWAAHGVANWTRKKEDRVSSKAAGEDLSNDIYGQLSQLVYNAKVHWEIQQRARGVAPAVAPPKLSPDPSTDLAKPEPLGSLPGLGVITPPSDAPKEQPETETPTLDGGGGSAE